MRLIISTRSNLDAAHSTEWGYKLRGRVYEALDGTEYDYVHERDEPPGFVTSCPRPFGDVREGERRFIMLASPDETMLEVIRDNLEDDPVLNIGEWSLDIEYIHSRRFDVGDPGSRNALETVTGVLVSFPSYRIEEYGIDRHLTDEQIESGQRCYWRPKFGMGLFINAIEANLDRKHRLFKPDHLPGPSDVPGQLFDSFKPIKQDVTFVTPVRLTENVEHTLVLSKWRLGYEVRDQDHRRHLNLALDCGIGERNPLGLGFVERVDAKVGDGLGGSS